MGILKLASLLAVLSASTAVCQLESVKYCDEATGICYSSYTNDAGISFRIALPENPTTSDAILQIVSPVDYNWVGLAWGGHMQLNPLTVAWPNGEEVIVSSRMANNYLMPPNPYADATYTYLKSTGVNSTHWTLTVRCQGCTRWDIGDGPVVIDTEDTAILAFAYSSIPPWEPASNTSGFDVHEQFGIWGHDLTIARSDQYDEWVTQRLT